jgi:translation initiation factor IF-2
MTDREPLKVYELAKELGIDSISLVDKLKGLDINVKNHMSELTDGDVEKARNVLKVGSTTVGAETATSAAKKTVTRKATGAGATAATKTPAKTATKTATKPVAKAAAPAPEAAPAATPAAKPVRKRAAPATPKDATPATPATPAATTTAAAANETSSSSSTVIRRRVLSDGATQTVTSTISTVTGTEKEIKAPEMAPPAEIALEAQSETLPAPPVAEPLISAPLAPPPAEPEAIKPSIKTSADGNRIETVRTEVKTEGGKTTTSVIRRTETTLTTYSLKDGLGKRPGGLRIIEQAKPEPAKPAGDKAAAAGATAGKGSFKSDRDGFKFARVDKENLDRMAEEEARKRGPKAFDAVIKPEDVKFSDYRKKEMIFIPKKKKAPVGKDVKKTEITVAAAHKRVVEMGDTIKVSELAQQMSVKAGDVIKKLMSMGTMANMNQAIDFDTATIIAGEFQFEVKNIAFREDEVLETTEEKTEDLLPRPPVVTIMGHVDHGKTTLLDSIREANVAAGEAGGITQHIGAYTIQKDGKLITFIDTPGHEAFTSMRARGANVTDIVVLVVSADDGVMPQTREALSHAKAAEVPIIVAVNKIDKPGANPEKIKQGLAELDLLAEDWGGETIYVPVSALKKTNIDKLLESILLVAEVQDLKAVQKGLMRGVVLESRVEKGRGPVASVLVNRGTLKIGDIVVSGTQWGRVKAMTNHLAESVKEVTPGMAAEILGLDGVPNAGEPIDSVKDEKAATTLVDHRVAQARDKKQMSSKASMEDLFARAQAGELKELRIVLKADVFGSVEAVKESLIKQSTDKVKVKVIHSAAGGITESDVMLANASNAIIIGFNVRPETKARSLAESEHIEIKCYNIIYELIDDVKLAMAGLLDKKRVETYLGRAEVRQTFSIPKAGTVAGCFVIDGKLVRNAQVRLLRDSRIIFDGKLNSLKRFKDDAKEVNQGYECGMGIDGYNDIKVGDLIEAYQIDMVAQEL